MIVKYSSTAIFVILHNDCMDLVPGDHRVRPQGRLADREKELGSLSSRIFRPGSVGHTGCPPSGEFCHIPVSSTSTVYHIYHLPGYHLSPTKYHLPSTWYQVSTTCYRYLISAFNTRHEDLIPGIRTRLPSTGIIYQVASTRYICHSPSIIHPVSSISA